MSQTLLTVHGEPTEGRRREDALPARIGRFVVLRQLGAGGMGVVYSAYDEELDRRVAIKVLHGHQRAEAHSVGQARLLREAQAMARVAHPNIAAIYEVGLLGDQVFVAMELVHGQTLRDWAAKPRRWRDVVSVYLQAARGLQAAHERGVIHRDFKPDNVLIGDDGRVRVLDFSLARSASHDHDDPAAAPGDAAPGSVSLTLAGKIVGTPAYMAPEQALGVAIDARADQFSFCVSLFEALFGRRPFTGQSLGELMEDILRDRLVCPPEVPLPTWLTRAVLRGLKPSPEQRWPGMAELLAELERDRTRWLRAATGLALAGLLAGLLLAGLELRARWLRAAAEQAAAERLTVLEASLGHALAEGRRGEAEAALAAFTSAPEHRDTPALAAAYLGWSRRMQAVPDLDAARLAAAQAYAAATDPQGTEVALEQLAELFRAQGAWDAAALLIADLRANHPALFERPEWVATAAQAARRRRDFADFARLAAAPHAPPELADVAPVLASLSHGTASTWDAVHAFPIAGEDTIGLFDQTYDDHIDLVRRDATLAAAGTLSLPGWSFAGIAPRVRPDDPPLMLAHRTSPAPEVAVHTFTPAGLHELLRFPSSQPLAAGVADLDGDGTPTLYLGTGPYRRELLALTPDAAGALQLHHPHPGTDAVNSDLQVIRTADLDGDGRDELVLAAGPWNAYDLRVYRPGAAAPDLELVARRKFGMLSAIGVLPGVDGRTRILAAKTDSYPSRLMFPADRQTGEPAGLYVLELDADQLRVVAHHHWPVTPGEVPGVSMFAVGDIDGDTRVDALATLKIGEQGTPRVALFRQLASGALAPVDIAGLEGIMLGQFDADPAAELLARVVVDEPTASAPAAPLWVLGAGTTPVPPLPLAHPRPASVPAGADPLVARAWRRAEQLASLGLVDEAARTIAGLTNLSESPALAADLRLRAADLLRSADRCAPAIALYEQVRTRRPAAALQGLVECFEHEGRYVEALASADALLARDDLPPEVRTVVRARAERLRQGSDAPALALALADPLAPGWRFLDPGAVRHDPSSGLVVDALVNHGELARLPLRCDGRSLSLRAELRVEHSEWGSGLDIAVRDAGATADAVGLAVFTSGGGGVFDRVLTCSGPDGAHTLEILRDTPADSAASYTLEVDYRPALGRLVCAVTRDGVRRMYSFLAPLDRPPSACELTLRARPLAVESVLSTRVRLHDLRLGGARLTAAPVDPHDPMRLLVEGDALAALPHLDDADPLHAVWRAMALEELGRWKDAARVLAGVELAPGSPARRAVLGLLRTRVASFGVLTRDAIGADAFRLHANAFAAVIASHPDDPRVRRTLAAAISDPSEFHPGPDDREGLLLRTNFNLYRARMWIAAAAYDRAAASLTAALADLPALGGRAPTDIPLTIHPALLAPTLAAARGDLEAARALLRESLADEPAPEIVRDLMRLQPLLRPLLDEP